MAISFNEITNLRIPFVRVEFNNANAVAGPQNQPYKGLILGHKTSGGSATLGQIYAITSADQAKVLFGAGSVLHNAAQIYFADSTVTDLSMICVAPGAGNAATGTITFTGSATASGLINLLIAGKSVTAAVTSGDSVTAIASAVTSAINANTNLPVTAGAVAGVVTLTHKHAGVMGNALPVFHNFYTGQETPAGVTVAITALSGGTGAPTLTTVFAAMGDTHYNLLVSPWTDGPTLGAINTELIDRGSAARQIEGVCISGVTETTGTANTLGNSFNSQFVSIINIKACPNPGYEIAAAILKQVMIHASIDPARPFQTLQLKGIIAPRVTDRLTAGEREGHLNNGIATVSVNSAGIVAIERLITTYKTNGSGGADTSYLDLNTLLTLSYIRYDFRNSLLLKFPRHKLANDSARIAPGQAVLTPKTAKAHAIAKFKEWEALAIVEDFEQFKRELVVERNVSNPNRLDFWVPVNLVNQLLQIGTQVGFIL